MKIYVFGDSIAWGAFDEVGGGRVERLKAFFFMGGQDAYEYGVYNFSISGSETRSVIPLMKQQIMLVDSITGSSKENNCILIALGTNDSMYTKTEDNKYILVEEFQSNIQTIIEIAQSLADKVIFIGALPVDESKTMPVSRSIDEYYKNSCLREYDLIIKELAIDHGCEYLDMRNCIDNKDLDDGCHPNARGHEKIFLRIKEFISTIFLG